MLRRTQMMNLLLLAWQGNHGGIAPTLKFKGYRRGCATGRSPKPQLSQEFCLRKVS
jgi:hypothetical protein